MKKLILALLLLTVTIPAFAGATWNTKIQEIKFNVDSGKLTFRTDKVLYSGCAAGDYWGVIDSTNANDIKQIQALLTAALLSGKNAHVYFSGCDSTNGASVHEIGIEN